ncbi:E3 ubiquitin-protein ligase TRIM45-like [Mytilus trossulus]|uniref:E3 ubiquitin-protein ligase TRIM45-like n=1 Tax=Mytilus trossulus TaxID=6551 RepID=UPI0030069598
MALSKPLSGNLEMFSCPICSETFKSPKILPCLHTFCEPCIHEFILSIGRKKDNKISEFACPICRTAVISKNSNEAIEKWASSLPDNTTITTMVALSNGDQSQECHACKRWNEKSDAKFWCKVCEEALCENCNQMHSRMKLLSTHDVVEIEEYGSNLTGIDLNGISNHCRFHPSKETEIFCFRHREACCVLCLNTKHIRCTGLKSIEDVLSEDDNYEGLPDMIEKVKDATIQLLKEKEQQKSDFVINTETVEEEAAKLTETTKCNLDNLFELFKKQLHIFRDEQNTNHNVRIRLLEQFAKSLEHWMSVTKIVKEEGTNIQLFGHVETMRSQIKASIVEINKTFHNDKLFTLTLKKNEIVEQLQNTEILGNFEQKEEPLVDQTSDLYKLCKELGVSTAYTFQELCVKNLKTFHFKGSNMTCGVSFGERWVIVGDKADDGSKLHLLEKDTGAKICSAVFAGLPKRLCYDNTFSQVFIACHKSDLYVGTIHGNEVNKPQKIAFDKESVGTLFSHNKCIFLVVENAIKKFVTTCSPRIIVNLCFSTNTKGASNGMSIHNGDIIFTTKDKEIKRATLEGKEIYSYKKKIIKKPECLAVLPSGLVLFIDTHNKGSLHVLSADGTKHRTLLEHFEKIQNPRDIWLDVEKKTIYIAGGEYIEAYSLF